MQNAPFGNGTGKGFVRRTPMAADWVLYHAIDPPPPEKELPLLQQDLAENPTIKVVAILPIVREGNTIAIHMWYTYPGLPK
jgi:hypothetical protein